MGPTKKHPSRRLRAYAGPRSLLCEVNFRDFYFGDHYDKIFCKLPARLPAGQLFELDFYKSILERRPEHVGAMEALGHLYTELGEYEKGLSLDQRLAEIKPGSPTAHYNLACSYSLLEIFGKALDSLRRAVELGYSDWEHMEKDQDLAKLRDDRRFKEFMSGLRSQVGGA
jgi:tetratricopeptide (TPR) repeat protein